MTKGLLRMFVAGMVALAAACGHAPPAPSPPGPPAISCAQGVAVRGVAQLLTYPAPSVSGGMLPVSAACTPSSGSLFDVGTTTVTCVAADAAGRQAQCVFGVTVTPFVLSIRKFVAVGDSVTEGQNGRVGISGRRIVDVPNAYP